MKIQPSSTHTSSWLSEYPIKLNDIPFTMKIANCDKSSSQIKTSAQKPVKNPADRIWIKAWIWIKASAIVHKYKCNI